MTESTTPKYVLVNCANLGAAGVLIRGKRITDDWQVHVEGCRDLKDLHRLMGSRNHGFEEFDTLDAARESFNADMGGGGAAGFEVGEGWDFDRDVSVKPCCKRK